MLPPDLPTTTLALLQDRYAFTQAKLLSPQGFIGEAKKRGVSLDREQLELLHRRRVLQPFYRVHSRPVADPDPSCPSSGHIDSALQEVRFALAEGHLSDPANRRFTPWPSPMTHPPLWYSSHQLLVLRPIRNLLAQMQAHPTPDRLGWHLAPLDARTREVFARQRSLAFLVESLAAKYRPRVVGSVKLAAGGDNEDLFRFIDSNVNPPGLRNIELPSDELVGQADDLLMSAHSFDPLGDWSQVVRIADPRHWTDLRYDALIAHDYRIAAEIILRYVEDQARQGKADPLDEPPAWLFHPRQERLRTTDRERAETVMRFGISDRPALVLAVEGHAEYEIAPRVLDMLGNDPLASRIVIVNMEGIQADVKLLARAVAVPRLDSDGDSYSRLLSPLTHLMVVVDPETPYERPDSVEAKKNEVIESVLNSLAPPHQVDSMRNDLAQILHIRRWPAEFEFAHWTDSELADALRNISPYAENLPRGELENRISQHRAGGDTFKSVWANWRSQPSKTRLARELWPSLERRIREPSASDQIPIVQVIQEAISIVHQTKRVTGMAPRGTPPQ